MFRIYWKIQAIGMKTKKKNIRVVAASVAGPAHNHKKLGCQDHYKHSASGRNFVGIVSDGAGSARYGKIGARILCETLVDLLKNAPFTQIEKYTRRAIEIARNKACRHRLNSSKNEKGLSDFAATLVGVVCRGSAGLFFHIGDGAALAVQDADCRSFIASPPENGNFSCETFFYTMNDWKQNLRFTRFAKARSIFLMSDGVTAFSFANDFRDIEKGFILPINNFLSAEKVRSKAVRALENTLNTAQARRLNSDDKTLLWAGFE